MKSNRKFVGARALLGVMLTLAMIGFSASFQNCSKSKFQTTEESSDSSTVETESAGSCEALSPCEDGVTCYLIPGDPTSKNQSWRKGSPNCGYQCMNGYMGYNCSVSENEFYCASIPCVNNKNCSLTHGTPTSKFQAWVKGASNCGFECIAGHSGDYCETPPSSCATQRPCNDGANCSLSFGPTRANQPWEKGALTCGFSCINGYSGATCQTPPTGGSFTCSPTVPACSPGSCTTVVGTPASANQAWTKDATNCGYSCTNNYTGPTCQTAPATNQDRKIVGRESIERYAITTGDNPGGHFFGTTVEGAIYLALGQRYEGEAFRLAKNPNSTLGATLAIYRCSNGWDWMISTSSVCEGASGWQGSLIGYGFPALPNPTVTLCDNSNVCTDKIRKLYRYVSRFHFHTTNPDAEILTGYSVEQDSIYVWIP